jgi:hypothetical protein
MRHDPAEHDPPPSREDDPDTAEELSVDDLILIVVGAHLRAEVGDRPVAYRLRQRMLTWLADRYGLHGAAAAPFTPLVCCDVWYLNDASLKDRPAISIGGPGVNALTAHLADKIPSAFVIDNTLIVQLDPAFDDLRACCWGMDTASTTAAVEAFEERYLDAFMHAATRGGGGAKSK